MIPEIYLRPQKVAFPRPAQKTRNGFKLALVIFLLVMLMICLSGGEHAVPLGR